MGIPEAVWIWCGRDYVAATKILNAAPRSPAELLRKGEVYRQVLSLLLSERRPSYYLVANRDALAALTVKYLRILCEAGVIDPGPRDARLDSDLHFRADPPATREVFSVRPQ